jgi:type I restriction enzyme M protein
MASATSPSNGTSTGRFSELTGFIWSVADLLRGDYKQADYGKVILPFTVLRRLDCVLDATKDQVLKKYESMKGGQVTNLDPVLNRITGVHFHNISQLTFEKLKGDPNHIAANMRAFIKGFSANAQDVIERFEFEKHIAKLDDANLLFQVVSKFAGLDLHPDTIPNHVMGSVFEELIRKFAELSNETAGEHFTPREVVRLMVNLLFIEDDDVLRSKGVVKTLFDPACGTGGMLSVSEEYLRELNPDAELKVFGQEVNAETFSVCKSDMMIKGQDPAAIVCGNSFSEDGHAGVKFDYMLSNPPFGVEWKKIEKEVRDEHESQGHSGRFGAGLPRINDGSFLFLQHMLSKMKLAGKAGEGSRIAIVFNGSPLFTGDAGSGESEIRRWILEHDLLEAIVALPDQLFYNTGISTYVWVLTNHKPKTREGKVQLINAVDFFVKMKKSLGNKRNELSKEHIETITRLFGEFKPSEHSKIFDNEDFGYRRITVERPLRLNFQASAERIERLKEERGFASLAELKKKGTAGLKEVDEGKKAQADLLKVLATIPADTSFKKQVEFEKALDEALKKAGMKIQSPVRKAVLSALSERDETAEIVIGQDGRPEPDPDLRDTENVPLKEEVAAYLNREVKPHVPDAWVDETKTKTGYEIPFTRHFYKYQSLRPLREIETDIKNLESEIQGMLGEVLR